MEKITKTESEWREELSSDVYHVCREHGTEAPFSGEYNSFYESGVYRCVCCGTPLFKSDAKFDSGTGWPSFFEPFADAITEYEDDTFGMRRVEVRCARCDAHLGHIFPDSPHPTGLRYCINSISLSFEPDP